MALQRQSAMGQGARAAGVGGLLAGLLAGCNPSDRAPQATLQPGVGFYLNEDGPMVSLAYGLVNSDDVSLMLQCRRGSRRVEISDETRQARGPAELILISGAARSALKADVAADEESGQPLASSQAPSDLPALAAFRRTGRLRVQTAGRDHAMAATAGERPAVARFFSVCERR